MEYVEGFPIDHFCDEHRLSITQRLHLFRTVCAAVQSAHQNLVVHRDLKPGNILVTPDGSPKLLDFGIAKLLNPDGGALTAVATAQDASFFTPDYASPEQIGGEPLTTSSDVYSLASFCEL
jgi:serine/threonine protein kinase